MCGIAGIIPKYQNSVALSEKLSAMSHLLQHRGPDGEGFLMVEEGKCVPFFNSFPPTVRSELPYLPLQKLPESGSKNCLLGFTHRRLKIIELSEKGHQPMCDISSNYWITYNGELYNYIELREELRGLGKTFVSESDTEVILNAYICWGQECVKRFNGMWSFCIYDRTKNICFASRDRFGVKPFYYTDTDLFFAFASEQKALVKSGLCPSGVNEEALFSYLVNSQLEYNNQNFFESIRELWPGHNLVYDLTHHKIQSGPYFNLRSECSLINEPLSDEELLLKIRETLTQAIRLRLRSDVEVGTCLSGGIDSSVIAVAISGITKSPLHCFTAVFRNSEVNEEYFADLAAIRAGGIHHKFEPDVEELVRELDKLVYSQDVPIWDTSTYAQFKVMELAAHQKIKVVLDGQGADELFAGYHHHFTALWNQLFSTGHLLGALSSLKASSRTFKHPLLFYLKENIKLFYNPTNSELRELYNKDFYQSGLVVSNNPAFQDLNEQLIYDIEQARLKSFLKCEDRCGMWHSVESRVPFSDDIELIRLLFSFNGNRKIKNGRSKHLLREAMKDHLPAEIYNRTDKKGFDTPSKIWLTSLLPVMLQDIRDGGLGTLLSKNALERSAYTHVQLKAIFRLFIYARWKKLFLN